MKRRIVAVTYLVLTAACGLLSGCASISSRGDELPTAVDYANEDNYWSHQIVDRQVVEDRSIR